MGLPDRTSFPAFPYQPYRIQQDFMEELYKSLEMGCIGLFESPTGTGKTLSIICSALQWLEDTRTAKDAASNKENCVNVPDWMQKPVKSVLNASKGQKEGPKMFVARKPAGKGKSRTPPKEAPEGLEVSPHDDLDDFILDDGDLGAVEGRNTLRKRDLETLDSSCSDDTDEEAFCSEAGPRPSPQVLFCSRTHSQLAQFVGELKRTPFASRLRVVALGSRKALCINSAVMQLGSSQRINERCLDLQKKAAPRKSARSAATTNKAKSRKGGCPFLRSRQSSHQLKEEVLESVMDVESLKEAGKARRVCPYYASRNAALEADLLLLPHSALLVQETREALGLKLEGSVVIVDEAHGLADAVAAAHSCSLSLHQIAISLSHLRAYLSRFRSRLSPVNLELMEELVHVATALLASLRESAKSGGGTGTHVVYHVNDFLFKHALHDINMFRLVRFIRDRKLLFKVVGYIERAEEGTEGMVEIHSEESYGKEGSGPLQAFLAMLMALNNADKDGRLILQSEAASLRYILLNAASHFGKVVAQARAVILASGTLSPVASLQAHLFPSVPAERMRHFSCGHVVGRERLLALAVGKGPSGRSLELRHGQRSLPALIDELGNLLVNVCQAVPAGVVVFFPSFAYAEEVEKRWEATGAMKRLASRKRVFREPRDSTKVTGTLRDFGSHIASRDQAGSPSGALLLCVVGAKMSEGINFGDDLARCVVVVGLPFPNPADPELKERMAYLDGAALGTASPQDPSPGRQYYEDLCMKAVNQCVGRVIRHRNDWAAIILADSRYSFKPGTPGSSNRMVEKLPGWVRSSLASTSSFGDAYSRVRTFCKTMMGSGSLPPPHTPAQAAPG
eukprot:jgi/Botrbrau1/5009/Bobra.0396s0030.1